MTTRDEMVEKAIQVLTDMWGREYPESRDEAEGILAAILPQVTTVAEIEALPAHSLLVNDLGFLIAVTNFMRSGVPGWRSYLTEELRDHGPFTVVWRP